MEKEAFPPLSYPEIPPKSVAEDIWYQLVVLAFGLQGHLVRTSSEFGLTLAQAHLLILLTVRERLSQREVANLLDRVPSVVVDMTDRLEQDGLIERCEHPADRRVNSLVVTRKGKKVASQLVAKFREPASPIRRLSQMDKVMVRDLLRELNALVPRDTLQLSRKVGNNDSKRHVVKRL